MKNRPYRAYLLGLTLFGMAVASARAEDGVFVRFKMLAPQGSNYFVKLGGYIHADPWYLPAAVVPAGADRDPTQRVACGTFTPWFDLKAHAGKRLHGRLHRAGGVAEFPNVTAEFVTGRTNPASRIEIDLATAPDARDIVKHFEESFHGRLTSFLVSPHLKADAADLETASQMTARRLGWARQASGGRREAPKSLLVETSFWGPQRPELNLQEGEVLWLLGFNAVGNSFPEVLAKYHFGVPGHMWIDFGPRVVQSNAVVQMRREAEARAKRPAPDESGMLFNFSDEITAPAIGTNIVALANFHAWLEKNQVKPADLGVQSLAEVMPIESPTVLKERQAQNPRAAARVFRLTSRFRQTYSTDTLRWLTEEFHRQVSTNMLTSTLVADHPYFAGTGFGMGMGPNPAWGSTPLALDWFDLARRRAVDVAGIEDWMGLQYMYGPNYTWEGFQLMGFQASIFRSGSRGNMPIMAWITPSDETNLCLKSASALCQGAKHFYYWTYGPTCTSTENYWSDLRSAYDGIVRMTRALAAAEPVLVTGRMRPTRVALLYSLSSDLWQPFGYVHMLERRLTYMALVHEQYLVDMLTEEDITAGRLKEYDVLYATDPCISEEAMRVMTGWVTEGGTLYGACAAGSRNEFNEEVPGLADVFGIASNLTVIAQSGRYHIRGGLNAMDYTDEIGFATTNAVPGQSSKLGVIGVKAGFTPNRATVIGTYKDGQPAVVTSSYGKGWTIYYGACPAIAYAKEAHFAPAALQERWPADLRALIDAPAVARGAPRVVGLSQPVVEAGVYDADQGAALVLANFTYQPIAALEVSLRLPRHPARVVSSDHGKLRFKVEDAAPPTAGEYELPCRVTFKTPLGLADIIVLEY